jgi:pimeloyl-ACP methyl ester carboxylesterase
MSSRTRFVSFCCPPGRAGITLAFHINEDEPMKSTLLGLAAATLLTFHPARAEDATGSWKGTIANSLNVFVEIKNTGGAWDATLTVPQQGLVTKVDQLVVSADRISFALLPLKAGYAAQWSDKDQAWAGTWTQGGKTTPLVFARAEAGAGKLQRPQEDAIATRPVTYTSTDVSIGNAAAGLTLAGTFSVPRGKGPFPAVVLVAGSGPQDRDENVLNHKLFLVLADHLNRQGIAVLRYDKRGVGKSGGAYKTATSVDFASDAEAAVRFLRARPEVDVRHIGIVGHSEGGVIAPLVAAKDPGVAFVVLLAGPGVRGSLLMVEQLARNARNGGVPDAQIAQQRAFHQALFDAIAATPDLALARENANRVVADATRNGTLPAGMSPAAIASYTTPWFHAFLRYEPAPALQAMRQPVLALNGALDFQVPATMNLGAIRIALQGNQRAVIREMPKLNHLFQTATTGGGNEYAVIEETFAPVALDTVSDWILATIN